MPDYQALERNGTTAAVPRVRPASPPDPLLLSCVSLLGWSGLVLRRVRLFDQKVSIVAKIDQAAHAARMTSGWGPVLDRTTLACWEELPELWDTVPPRVVSLVGVLCRDTAWRRALARSGGFIGFCATAFVLDGEPNDQCMATAHWYGIGVLRAAREGIAELVQVGRDGPSLTSRPSAITRFAEEQVYQRILDDGLVSAP